VLSQVIGPVCTDHICSPAVRHAWEHLDERLDSILESGRYKTYSHFSVAVRAQRADHLDFRRLDPETLTLSFADELILLKPCLSEIRELDHAVVAAHSALADGRVVPWR
jgi:hypothetical protein